jgi:Flp pilus assembly pilin Flp
VQAAQSLSTAIVGNLGQKTGRRTRDMDKITGLFVKVREYQRGQTMAEYALILAAVAVVVFIGYQLMGTTITTLLTSVDGQL